MTEGNRSYQFIILSSCCIAVPTFFVILRLWSRIVASKGKIGWDDWICLSTLVFSLALDILALLCARSGLGQHADAIPLSEVEHSLHLVFAASFCFCTAIGLVKISALLLYRRIFNNIGRRFHIAIFVGIVLTVIFMIYANLQILLSCLPIRKYWNVELSGRCLSIDIVYLATGTGDTILDLYVLLIPLPLVWQLNMGTKRKAIVTSAFVVGYCSVVASLGRLISIAIVGDKMVLDFTWNADKVLMWSIVEPSVGIISICLPPSFQLLRRAYAGGFFSLFHSREIPIKPFASERPSASFSSGTTIDQRMQQTHQRPWYTALLGTKAMSRKSSGQDSMFVNGEDRITTSDHAISPLRTHSMSAKEGAGVVMVERVPSSPAVQRLDDDMDIDLEMRRAGIR